MSIRRAILDLGRSADSPALGELRRELAAHSERSLLLSGSAAAMVVRSIDQIQSLGDVAFRVTSQFGEDGILEWLIAKIPAIVPSFIEFGVENYSECNTRFLLQRQNWRGLVADGSRSNIDAVRSSELVWRHDLTAVHAFIDRKNINRMFVENGFKGEIGLLSIDIDGNDYWIWDAISVVNPQMVVCEYNAIFGDLHSIVIPVDDSFDRTAAHSSNLYWGASIRAVNELAERRGYTLIGSNREGCNAFFLRNDLMMFVSHRIADRSAMPSLFRESRAPDGTLSYVAGAAHAEVIGQMPVVNLHSNEIVQLKELGRLYSDAWLRRMGVIR